MQRSGRLSPRPDVKRCKLDAKVFEPRPNVFSFTIKYGQPRLFGGDCCCD